MEVADAVPGEPELVLDARAWLGEGPSWDAERGVLWWVDILDGVVHAFDPADGTDRSFALLRMERDGRLVSVLTGPYDAQGPRLAVRRRHARLHRLDPARGHPVPVRRGDRGPRPTRLPALARLPRPSAGRRPGRDGRGRGRSPLGRGLGGGGCVLRVSPDGDVVDRLDLPVSQPTSCAFGGADLRDLYVTSAREGLDPGAARREPLAGGIFRFRPSVAGLPLVPHRPRAPEGA
jgi:sugar lactone lactonase YvrE